MVKNVILDIGNVLAHFQWEKIFTEVMGVKDDEFDELAAVTTKGPVWDYLDSGRLSDEEVIERCVALAPHLEDRVREFYTHLGELVCDFDYSKQWILDMKVAGYKVYVLSNYGKTSFEQCRANGCLGFVDDADGALISYQVKMVKPEKEIYEALLAKFELKGEECLFFDDLPANIAGAEAAGINGHLFVGYEDAIKTLNEVGAYPMG